MEAAARPFSAVGDERASVPWRIAPAAENNAAADAAVENVSAEQTLLSAARRGDKQAFSQIVLEHQQAVYGFLRARVLEPADAEDMTQDVFLRCYVGHEKLERATAIRAWLIGIARNLLHEHARRARRRREVAWTELCLELDRLTDGQIVPENAALQHLPGCLDSLGKSARQALDMNYHAKLRFAEIGSKLKRSEGAIKLLMFRARQALRHCLDGKLKHDNQPYAAPPCSRGDGPIDRAPILRR